MGGVLHLLKRDSPAPAHALIAQSLRAPGARATVVLLDDADPPALPAGVPLRRLGRDLDHDGLLDLIFAHDHVITW